MKLMNLMPKNKALAVSSFCQRNPPLHRDLYRHGPGTFHNGPDFKTGRGSFRYSPASFRGSSDGKPSYRTDYTTSGDMSFCGEFHRAD